MALALPRVGDADGAAEWLVSYNRWERDFAGFLDEKSEYADGGVNDMHQRFVKARRMIRGRIRENQLFTFLDEGLAANAMTDERLERLYRRAWGKSTQGMHETFGIPVRHGTGIDWNEFHTRIEWQSND